jgi:hypothetical protein
LFSARRVIGFSPVGKWHILAEDHWYIVAEYAWRSVAEYSWYSVGECHWYIIGCSVTVLTWVVVLAVEVPWWKLVGLI